MGNINGRTYIVDFYRFIFSLVIAIYHFEGVYFGGRVNFAGGFRIVEFFFILSGFLLMRKVEDNRRLNKSLPAWKYLLNRLDKFYPEYLFALLAYYVFYLFFVFNGDLKKLAPYHFGLTEVLMLQSFGFNATNPATFLNHPMWFLSAVLIASYFLYFIATKYENNFKHIFAPLLVIVLYAYLSMTYGNLGTWREYSTLLLPTGVLRAIAGICLGCICYQIYTKLEVVLKGKKLLLLFIELFSIVSVGVLVKNTSHNYDFVCLLVFPLIIITAFLNRTVLDRLLSFKFLQYFGTLSFAIYANHYLVMRIFAKYIPDQRYLYINMAYLAVVIIYSVLTNLIVSKIYKFLKNRLKHTEVLA